MLDPEAFAAGYIVGVGLIFLFWGLEQFTQRRVPDMTVFEQIEYARGVFGQIEAAAQQPFVPGEARVRLSEIEGLATGALAQLAAPPTPFAPEAEKKD